MLNNLIDLYELTGDRSMVQEAAAVLASLSRAVADSPVGSINATRGLLRLVAIDPDLVEQIGLGADRSPEVVRTPDAPLQVFASEDRIIAAAGRPAELRLELRIAPGFHITAHDPGMDGLIPFSIELRGGSGASLQVDYPVGQPYAGEALPPEDRGRLRVYSGLVPITLRVGRSGEPWSGRPIIVVTYQACDDEACFQPMIVELDVAIDPG